MIHHGEPAEPGVPPPPDEQAAAEQHPGAGAERTRADRDRIPALEVEIRARELKTLDAQLEVAIEALKESLKLEPQTGEPVPAPLS